MKNSPCLESTVVCKADFRIGCGRGSVRAPHTTERSSVGVSRFQASCMELNGALVKESGLSPFHKHLALRIQKIHLMPLVLLLSKVSSDLYCARATTQQRSFVSIPDEGEEAMWRGEDEGKAQNACSSWDTGSTSSGRFLGCLTANPSLWKSGNITQEEREVGF